MWVCIHCYLMGHDDDKTHTFYYVYKQNTNYKTTAYSYTISVSLVLTIRIHLTYLLFTKFDYSWISSSSLLVVLIEL